MADEIESPTATQAHQIFGGSYCEKISYEIRVKQEDVKLDNFLSAVGVKDKEKVNRGAFACAPKNQGSDYHLHVAWRLHKGDFRLEIEFVEGAVPPAPGEKEPYAEELVSWVEKFLLSKTVRASIDLDFIYPSDLRQSKFPLPLRAGIGKPETQVTLDGISLKLPPGIHGVDKIWVTQGDEKLWVHARGEKLIDLTNVQVRKDIDVVASVVGIVVEEKRPEEKATIETENPS